MNRILTGLAAACVFAGTAASASVVPLEEVTVNLPAGWAMKQEGRSADTLFVSFSDGSSFVNLYAKAAIRLDMKDIFANGAQIDHEATPETHGSFDWKVMHTSKHGLHIVSFLTEFHGKSYYGYTRSEDAATADSTAATFMESVCAGLGRSSERSLTGADYTGKKYYYGLGDALSGFMGNEVKFDIKHTNDIFTSQNGGSYIGVTQLSPGHDGVVSHWTSLKSQMTANDMYIQYSSGHGSHEGLMVGVDYDEIRDNALSMPAKEVIIFTMACYSGNLVSAFNDQKDTWSDWQSKGRTLFVMASSKPNQSSSTNPSNTDPDEPDKVKGSSGSAFGNALWKSLIGYADGYVDGVKDGFTSLEEIRDYSINRTKELGGHTPVTTGAYQGNLIMDKVPSKALVARLEKEGGTDGMTDEQIMAKVRELDRELSVR